MIINRAALLPILAAMLLGLGGLWYWWSARSSALPVLVPADVTAQQPAMA